MAIILVFILTTIAILLLAMWLSPAFKDMVASKWGVVGTVLLAILGWAIHLFGGGVPMS